VGKCISICRNPQNVGSPEAGPSADLSAPSAVCKQLDALQNNSQPRHNHGLAVVRAGALRCDAFAARCRADTAPLRCAPQAYEFCGDADAFQRSRYFGISKDIYQVRRCFCRPAFRSRRPALQAGTEPRVSWRPLLPCQFDHFMSAWAQHFPGFLELKGYDVVRTAELADGRCEVEVSVTGRSAKEARAYVFVMKRQTFGKYAGCWVTHRLLAADSKFRGEV
jgi:hypothetical protein